jgi:hypothetical protein
MVVGAQQGTKASIAIGLATHSLRQITSGLGGDVVIVRGQEGLPEGAPSRFRNESGAHRHSPFSRGPLTLLATAGAVPDSAAEQHLSAARVSIAHTIAHQAARFAHGPHDK